MARTNLNKYDEGRYRLTVVKTNGDTRTKLYLSWQKCASQYYTDTKDESTQYAIIINQTDSEERYWNVKDEYHKSLKPRLW